jgi:hypothetical protein
MFMRKKVRRQVAGGETPAAKTATWGAWLFFRCAGRLFALIQHVPAEGAMLLEPAPCKNRKERAAASSVEAAAPAPISTGY